MFYNKVNNIVFSDCLDSETQRVTACIFCCMFFIKVYKGEMKNLCTYVFVCCPLSCVVILLLLLASWQEVGHLQQVVGEEFPLLHQSSFGEEVECGPSGLQVKSFCLPSK